MPFQTWQQTLAAAETDGAALSATITQTSIIPTAAKYTLPGNSLRVGSQLKQIVTGRISNVVTTPGNILFKTLFGAIEVVNNGGTTQNLNIVAKTNVAFWLEVLMTVRSIGTGTAATVMWQQTLMTESIVGASAGIPLSVFIPPSAPAVGAGFDSTVANAIDLQAKFSVATAGTALTVHQYRLESLN